MSELKVIEFKPGFNRNTTPYDAEQQWVEGDKVRFRNTRPEKIGGWEERPKSNDYFGVPRALESWTALDAADILGVGTHQGLYVYSGATYYNITPVVSTYAVVSGFESTSGSDIFRINLTTSVETETSTLITLTNPATVGGVVVNAGDYEIVSADEFYFDFRANVTAGSTQVSAVPSVNVELRIPSGSQNNLAVFGYGSGGYGLGGFGESENTGEGFTLFARQWSLGIWGEDLIANPRGGAIYLWEKTANFDNKASVITNAPTRNNFILVAEPARHLVSFGTCVQGGDFDPMYVRWSSDENFTVWDAATTNASGGQRIQGGSFIVGAESTKREIGVFTDKVMYSMEYVGYPTFFNFTKKGENCGLVSQNGVVEVNGILYWMGYSSFFRYDGAVRPLESTVEEVVFDPSSSLALNFQQKEKVYAGVNSDFYEIWWFYPSQNSLENDRYVIYNYVEDVWYDGMIERTAWVDSDIFRYPIAADTTKIYNQEIGKNADGEVLPAYIKSGQFDISDGDQLMFTRRYVPDFKQEGDLSLSLHLRKYPYADVQTKGPYVITPETEHLDFRARARSVQLEISSSVVDGDFEFGKPRILVQTDGKR